MKLTQVDMFGDFSKQTEVIKCIAGISLVVLMILIQKNVFYATAAKAKIALESGQ